MKNILIILLLIIFSASCQTPKSELAENNQSQIESTPTPKAEIPELTKEQLKKLDESIPPEARKVLENAEEFTIESGNGSIAFWTPNKSIKINDKDVMKNLLKAIYQDIAKGAEPTDCFKPRHALIAKYKDKNVSFLICYECSNFRDGAKSDFKVGGMIDNKYSKTIFDQILQNAEDVK
jgi:hypothetical protein